MKEIFNKLINKITLYKVTLIVILLVLLFVLIYYTTMFIPKKIKIGQAEELNEESYVSSVIQNDFKQKIKYI